MPFNVSFNAAEEFNRLFCCLAALCKVLTFEKRFTDQIMWNLCGCGKKIILIGISDYFQCKILFDLHMETKIDSHRHSKPINLTDPLLTIKPQRRKVKPIFPLHQNQNKKLKKK